MAVPFILGAIALTTGIWGVKKGVDAKEKVDQIKSIENTIKSIAKYYGNLLETTKKDTKKEIEDVGLKSTEIMTNSMLKFVNIYKNIKNVNFKELGIDDLENFKPGTNELKTLEIDTLKFKELAISGAGGMLAGGLLAAGAYGAVMSGGFALASTGTVISTLAGVAAKNATLAWLGGGSLAAGGYGMVGGMVVLGGIVTGPAIAITGGFLDNKAEKVLYKALEEKDKAIKWQKDVEKTVVTLNGIKYRANQIKVLLDRLNSIFVMQLNKFENIVGVFGYDYAEYPVNAKHIVAICAMFAKIIKIIIDTPLLTEDGVLTNESGIVVNCFTTVADSGDLDKDDLAKFIRNYNAKMEK